MNAGYGSERRSLLNAITQGCSLLTAGIGFMALLGWVAGVPLLCTFGPGWTPMAPSAALFFLLYGAVAFALSRSPLDRAVQRVGVFIGSVVALAALVLFLLSSLGIHPEAEHLGIRIAGTVNRAPIAHISPLTAFCFVLAGLSFFASLSSSSGRRWRTAAIFGFPFLIVFISVILLTAYLLGSPFLYGGSVIPPALSTSLGFLTLGIALSVFSWQRTWTPGRWSDTVSTRATYVLILIFVLTATGLVTAGYVYFRNLEEHYHAEVEHQLSAIAELKVDQLSEWRKQRLEDAAVLFKNPAFSALVKRYFENPRDLESQGQLWTWLKRVRECKEYDRISLLDPQGAERMAIPSMPEPVSPHLLHDISETLQSRQVVFLGFHRDAEDRPIRLEVLIPIIEEQNGSRVVGILVLRINPAKHLYPLLTRWPTPSQTAETMLVRRDQNEVEYLNELKSKKNTPLRLRVPLDRKQVPAVKAVLGQTGITEGRDSRGVPVIADLRAIPGSRWFLVTRVDAAEVYAPLRKRLWEIVILISALLICAGSGVGFVWRHQLTSSYREKYEASEALSESQARFRRLAESAPDLIYRYELTPQRGFTYINAAATTITGYTLDDYYADPELRNNIVHPEDRHLLEETTKGGFLPRELTLRWVRKDGTLIWVELRRVPIYADEGNLIAVEGVARDITDRKRAEEALAESENRFRELFENMSSGVAVYEAVDGGADFVFHDFNAAGARIEQTPREAVIGRRLTEVFPGVGPMGLLGVLSRVWKTGIPEHYPITFYKDEKHAGWRENYVYRLQSGEIVAIYDDITARKRAEEALAEREKHFRALIENGLDLITEMDTQGIIRYQSPSVQRELGYHPDELIGRSAFDYIHPDDLGKVMETFSLGIENPGNSYSAELRFRHRDGSWRVLEASGKFVTNQEGFTGVIVNSRDVTERRRAEEKIANLNRTLRAVRDINQMIAKEKDPRKLIHRTSEILVEHPAYHAALLILTDEAGKPLAHAVAGMKEVFQPMVERLGKGTVPPCCEAARLQDGVLCVSDHSGMCAPCLIPSNCDRGDIMCIRLPHGETTYGYLAGSVARELRTDPEEQSLFTEVASDVAFALHNLQQDKAMQKMHEERDRFEADLRQAQKMEAIGALAGGIAHDFNNILTAIIGYTQLADQDADRDSLLHRNLQEVLKAGNRAKDLVRQILTFSRQSEKELVPVRIKLIVKEALKLIRASLPSTIEIREHIQSDSTVWSNPTQIHQVVMNLCTNAAYAMRVKGGILEVNLNEVALDRRSTDRHPDSNEGQYVVLEVSDTGDGVDPSIKDRIFDPFFTTKERGEGTGMGLAVVQGIVKSSGGFISMYSEVGRGSTFKIYFPSAAKKEIPEAPLEPSIPGGKERILFVDDEPALVDMAKQVLERMGYRVTCRTSSIEALALFQAAPDDFDLVITDITMPKMTGEELARKILRLRKNLPVIICTGFSTNLTEQSAKEIGIRAFVMKPLVAADLARTIRQCLDQKN